MTFIQYLKIVYNSIIFIPVFTCWYIDIKWNGASDGLVEDYLFWHKSEYKNFKKFAPSQKGVQK